MKVLGVITNWSGFKAFTVLLVILKRFCVFFHLHVIKIIKNWWWIINCLHVVNGSARNKFWWSYLLDIWHLDWFPVAHTMLCLSQVSVSCFLQIGNIDVEQQIKFFIANIFVVKSHLDSIFTDILPIRLNSAFVIVLVGPGCHGYTTFKSHSIWHLLMCLFLMENCNWLCSISIFICLV